MTAPFDLQSACVLDSDEVLRRLDASLAGLSSAEASRRLVSSGPNEIGEKQAGAWDIFLRQLKNPFLLLLAGTALLSVVLGDRSDAYIIFAIVALSVGLAFFNEYRSETAIADLRARVQRSATVKRDGVMKQVPVAELVPGDLVELAVGDIVPADLRLLDEHDLECDESALTGESVPTAKTAHPVAVGATPLDLDDCALMGTVVKNGAAHGVVVATGRRAAIGSIATSLATTAPVTAFEKGLNDFSRLLIQVTAVLTVAIFGLNALLHHGWLESLLFALSIAIGITPQLLPAIVTVSLSVGARALAEKSVIVKRLVSIEDLGNVQVLFTDKTGTLTEGRIVFRGAFGVDGKPDDRVATLGLACISVVTDGGRVVSGNALDVALLEGAPAEAIARAQGLERIGIAPFDYERQMMSTLVDFPDGRRLLICKGAPERVLKCCRAGGSGLEEYFAAQFESGDRIVAVATRDAANLHEIHPSDETELELAGCLHLADEPKADAAASLARLRKLGVEVKIVTGDNDQTARAVCRRLGMEPGGVLTGVQLAAMTDDALAHALDTTAIFARVTPEQKTRIIEAQRKLGKDVGFLGDGVNDAGALHGADVGISVDSASDVAKDAADIVLLKKDLGVLADGVAEGRRIFCNTIKYVLMDVSSNFGNMFSAAGASLILPFLPMLPSQILLNNLLYDTSEMAIPTDNVDDDLLQRPSQWDTNFIKRFMIVFGPVSSAFDFITFGVMIWFFHAGAPLFHTGWFVESLSTQSLVVFLIRTRRVPFFRSRPSSTLIATTLGVVALGLVLPFLPFASALGFVPLPPLFFAILTVMIVTYLGLIELCKMFFFGREATSRS